MPQLPKRSAGWTRGVSRGSSVYILSEFKAAVDRLADDLKIPRGIVVERALIAFMEALPNGTGAMALHDVAEVRHHSEADRSTQRCAEITPIGTQCIHDAVAGGDRCGHHRT